MKNNINIQKLNNDLNIIKNSDFLKLDYENIKNLKIENNKDTNINALLFIKKDTENLSINLKENTINKFLIIVKEDLNTNITFDLERYTKLELNFLQYSKNSKINILINNNGIFSESFSNSLVISNNNDLNILNFKTINNNQKTIIDTKAYGVSSDSSKVVLNFIGKINNKMSGSSCHEELKGINRHSSKIEVNPILEIDEFDVSAGHGASCGNISQDILFYMQSRGLSRQMAENIYLLGFINPFFENISDPNLKNQLLNEVIVKL